MKIKGVGPKAKSAFVAVAVVAIAAACSSSNTGSRAAEQKANTDAVAQLIRAQPIPQFTFSQVRQNKIEIETAQAQGVQTTSFFFNQGVQEPILSCPSVGYPIPQTDELSAPEQFVGSTHGNIALPQAEPTGLYTGVSTATDVMCIDATGHPYATYWEGFVQTVTGPATWDSAKHQVVLTGPPSFTFTKGK